MTDSAPSLPAPASGARHRVLVADDDPVSREMAQHILRRLGHEADSAGNGAAALAAHRARSYDLILMDCEMPVLDGFAATRRLRAEEGDGPSRTPVLGLSARVDHDQREHCRAAGMDGLLPKPLLASSLRDALLRWLAPDKPEDTRSSQQEDDALDVVCANFGPHFPHIVALYQRDGAPRLEALRVAQQQGDMVELARVAHALSGSSMAIGATRVATLSAALERAARGLRQQTPNNPSVVSELASEYEQIVPLLETLEREYRHVCARLQELLARQDA